MRWTPLLAPPARLASFARARVEMCWVPRGSGPDGDHGQDTQSLGLSVFAGRSSRAPTRHTLPAEQRLAPTKKLFGGLPKSRLISKNLLVRITAIWYRRKVSKKREKLTATYWKESKRLKTIPWHHKGNCRAKKSFQSEQRDCIGRWI